ncbi:hypothetical protein FPQ18DRAFT_416823, partial [Pyronema domesticum]
MVGTLQNVLCLNSDSVLESELELGVGINDVGGVDSSVADVVDLNVGATALAAVSASSALGGLNVLNEDGVLLDHLISDNAGVGTASGGSKAGDDSRISGDAASIGKDDGSGSSVHDTGGGNTSSGVKDLNADGLEPGDSVGVNEVNGDGSITSGTGGGGGSGGSGASGGVSDNNAVGGGSVTVVDGNVDGNRVSGGGIGNGRVIDNDDNGVSRSRFSYNNVVISGDSFTGGDVDGNILGGNGVGKSNGGEGADSEESAGDH